MRLLALDVDHTLTGTGNLITDPNAAAVAWAMERGVKVTLITGRRYALSAELYARRLGVTGPMGVHYGRRIVTHPEGGILWNHPLPTGAVRAILEAAHRFPQAIISAFVGDELRFEKLPEGLDPVSVPNLSEGALDDVLADRPDEIMSVNVTEPAGSGAARAVAEVARTYQPGLLESYFSPWAGDPAGLITVLSAAADKGTALLEIARLAGVDPADTLAMGDSEADVPMIKAAGVGVAMPWSPPEVRAAADLVAEGDPEDAVARAIRSLLK